MKPLSFIIIGSGWRARFYIRIAKQYPEQFQLAYLLCRREEKVDSIARELGIKTTTSKEVCEKAKPDFVVIAVSKGSGFEVAKEWALKGFAVLCETPAAMDEKQLKELWKLKEHHKVRIQVAEQYIRYPIIKAGLRAVKQGKLGEPNTVNLSVAHDYHGVSLIRHMLNIGLEPVQIYGKKYLFPVTETACRYGAVTDGSIKAWERFYITMEFSSGKIAFYDFSGVQYHSFIRSRHINVQGRDGERNDTILRFVGENYLPKQERLFPYLDSKYRALETEDLKKAAKNWNPVLELENVQDEYAISSMMLDMREYLERGKEVYPLAEALEDAYIWILMQRATEVPGTVVESSVMPWHTANHFI